MWVLRFLRRELSLVVGRSRWMTAGVVVAVGLALLCLGAAGLAQRQLDRGAAVLRAQADNARAGGSGGETVSAALLAQEAAENAERYAVGVGGLRDLAYALGGAQLLLSIGVIAVTVHVAAMTRQEQTEIMRLVGASPGRCTGRSCCSAG